MKRLPLFLILTLFLLPIFGGALYVIVDEFKDHESMAISSREMSVHMVASLVKEKLARAVDVGVSLAGGTLCRQSAENERWEDALKSVKNAKENFTYIDDITLFDAKGILKATTITDRSVIGKDFSYRDYYQGVSKKWEPYVSEVFKRMAEPKYSVVVVAVPIKSDTQKILGVLLLSLRADSFNECVSGAACGSLGSIYIVDQKGHLVVHPRISPENDIINYSLAPAVQKILKGESGVEVLSDPMESEKQLIAYAPVLAYGWGVAVLQSEGVAFSSRNQDAINFSIVFALGIFIIGFSLYRILRDRIVMKAQRDREAILLESIGDGVVAIDRKWNITLWNKAASTITGWSKEEALGKSFCTVVKFIRERDRAEDVAFIEDAMVRGRSVTMADNTILVKKDGSEISVGDSAAPIFGSDGNPEGVVIVFRDVSSVREKSRLRSDFAYSAHQLRTPITEALWNLEIAIDEQDPDKRKDDLRVVHQSLFNIKKLSEDIVTVSELDQGSVAVRSSPVKLVDVLTEMHSKLEAKARTRDIVISVAPVSPLMAVTTDKKLLCKALFEIVENAVAYSRPGSKVEVTASLQDQENKLLVEVSDTGVGIPEEEQPIIFTKFFRGSNRGKEVVGDGLGLYLAKAYITLLGGKIWFKSEEGKGTTFFISLPIA